MEKPVVSILVPVYNVENYVGRCLESILSQTLSDIEVICVNDGSTDDSLEVLREYEKTDSRIRIIDKENGGLPSARNAGLDAAKGRFVGFVDSDDYIESDMFKKMVAASERDGSDVVICGANILPESEECDQWLYECLTPKESFYKKFKPEILFRRKDMNPFLWRTLIRRSLIEQYKLRLDEDIVLGEDKAFQAKVYPRANGITVIPDKLYNYDCSRSDSIMSRENDMGIIQKIFKHVVLIKRMGTDISAGMYATDDEFISAYLEWSIPFIYGDFLYIPQTDKVTVADSLIEYWQDYGYYKYEYSFPDWIKDAFRYMKMYAGTEKTKAGLSIVLPVEYISRYLSEMLRQIARFSDDIEIVIINNGMPEEYYVLLLKLMMSQSNIRLYNTPKHFTYDQCLNMGNRLASGEYISYLEPQDWYISVSKLMKWFRKASSPKIDICFCDYTEKRVPADIVPVKISASDYKKEEFYLDFHDALYRTEFLKKEKLIFTDASVLTGKLFLAEAIIKAKTWMSYQETIYVNRKYYRQDWLSLEKCEKVLEALDKMVDLSLEYRNPYLHGLAYSILNGDVITQIIEHNTRASKESSHQFPNGENSQVHTVKTLFDIANKMNYGYLKECGYTDQESCIRTLWDVLLARQYFLTEINGN
ncbi:MAG: glycosyltransferase family 2 protein [Clostridiales bacterium]|nr:glycosyltransferase family 2 protein [Clostridiales bacterium]